MKLKQKLGYLMILPAIALGAAMVHAGGADKRTTDMDKRTTAASATNAPAKSMASKGAQARASDLIGKNVTNPQGEDLGEIKDLVVDTKSGNVRYAVIAFGGFLGFGEDLYTYPLERFKRSADGDKLVLDVDKEKMKSAPGFDADAWPVFTTRYYADVDLFYGTKPATGDVRYARASEILDGDVKDAGNNDIGDIEDLVVSIPDGRVTSVVLEFDRAWNPDDKLVAMPMKALKYEDGGTDLVYTASKEELKEAPSFESSRWPDLSDERFRADVGRYEQTWNDQSSMAKDAQQGRSGTQGRMGDEAERTGDRMSAPSKE